MQYINAFTNDMTKSDCTHGKKNKFAVSLCAINLNPSETVSIRFLAEFVFVTLVTVFT